MHGSWDSLFCSLGRFLPEPKALVDCISISGVDNHPSAKQCQPVTLMCRQEPVEFVGTEELQAGIGEPTGDYQPPRCLCSRQVLLARQEAAE